MSEDFSKYDFDYFEKIYKETFQKGETFSSEIGEEIAEQLQKMAKEYNDWLKNRMENDTGTISESIENQ